MTNETKTENKKEELRHVYLVDYYIKDLSINKFLETNVPDKIKPDVNDKVVIFKGKKPILEGMGNLFPKVEEFIKNAKDNDESTMKLTAIDAYGLRNKELIRVVPLNAFKQNKINPFVGLTFEAEGTYGVVKSVSGGRVMVDFNSPYADHDIEVYIKKIKTCDEKETIETILENFFSKTGAKLKSFENEKIVLELMPQGEASLDMYKQIFEGFFKNFVKYKELVLEAKK
jgi:peptidylprolyl isomerase